MGLSNFPNGISAFGIPVMGDSFVPHMGDTYFVKKTADSDYSAFRDRYDGVTIGGQYAVCTTADEAFARAGKHDRIIFCTPDSGGHDLTKTITIGSSQFGLKVFGDMRSHWTQRTTIRNPTAAADNDMFIVTTDKVEFAGLCFQNRKAGSCIEIGTTAGTAFYNIYIHDCNFTDYGGVATYGVTPGDAAAADTDQCDPVNLTVERCYFDGFVTAACVSNGTRDAFIDNYIKTAAGASGIYLFKHTDSRGKGTIKGNYIMGVNSTDTGILVTDVGSSALTHCITDNYIIGCATTITTQTNLQGGGNWYADANGQWVYIDIVT